MKKLKVTRTITSVTIEPFNEDFYPNMNLEQAVEYEKSLEAADFGEYFFDGEGPNGEEFPAVETTVEVIGSDA